FTSLPRVSLVVLALALSEQANRNRLNTRKRTLIIRAYLNSGRVKVWICDAAGIIVTENDYGLRVEFTERCRYPICHDDVDMVAPQLARLIDAAGMGDHPDPVGEILMIEGHPLGFIGGVKAFLQLGIMGRNTGGAGILMALHRLDTAQRKHETTGTVDKVRTCRQGPGHRRGGDQLTGNDQLDTIFKPGLAQQVYHPGQGFLQGQPHIVHQRLWRSAGTAVGTVEGTKIGSLLNAAYPDRSE